MCLLNQLSVKKKHTSSIQTNIHVRTVIKHFEMSVIIFAPFTRMLEVYLSKRLPFFRMTGGKLIVRLPW